MGSESVTSDGMLKHGKQFYRAALAVEALEDVDQLPFYFLLGRSTELLLKSYLLLKGETVTRLRSRSLGHSLSDLYAKALELGLSDEMITEPWYEAVVSVLNIDYSSKRFEYREEGETYYLADPAMTKLYLDRLIQTIDETRSREASI